MNSNIVRSVNNTLNPQYQKIGHEFAKIYYDRMTNHGVHIAFELFSPNLVCTIDLDEFMNSYNWLLKMTKSGIAKFEYLNISGTCQPLPNYEILITVYGNFIPINLWDQRLSDWLHFNETFILEKNGDVYYIRNYVLKTY